MVVLHIGITNALRTDNTESLISSPPDQAPASQAATTVKRAFHSPEAPEIFDRGRCWSMFANLTGYYRFHKPDSKQITREKAYWSFLEAAKKTDGVRRKQVCSWLLGEGRRTRTLFQVSDTIFGTDPAIGFVS